MKKLSLSLLVLALALAITPAALADSFNFTVTGVGNSMSASGVFYTTSLGNGVYSIDSVVGTFTDLNKGLNIVDESMTLVPTSDGAYNSSGAVNGSAGPSYLYQGEQYTNLLYVPAVSNGSVGGTATPEFLDGYGFLFTSDGYLISIAGDPNNLYGGWLSIGSNASYLDPTTGDGNYNLGEPLDMNVTPTPEPSSLFLLGTGLLGLALVVFRKVKGERLALNITL